MSNEGNPFQSPGLEGVRGSCTSVSEVEFDYVMDDTVWFCIRENRHQHKTQIRKMQITFGCFALIMVMIGLGFFGQPNADFISLPMFGAAAYFLYRAVFAERIFLKTVRRVVERMITSRQNAGITGQTTVHLEDEGFTIERPGGRIFWRWWAVPEVSTDEGYLMMYIGGVEACLVPSRAFESKENFNAFAANAIQLWQAKKRN